MDYISS